MDKISIILPEKNSQQFHFQLHLWVFEGNAIIQHLISDDPSNGITVRMCYDPESTKKQISVQLFGREKID